MHRHPSDGEPLTQGGDDIAQPAALAGDILGELAKKKGNRILVGFAVEVKNELERGKEKLRKKNLDLIVVNNPLVEGAGFGEDTNVVTMIDRRGSVERLPLLPKHEVAREVLRKILALRKK